MEIIPSRVRVLVDKPHLVNSLRQLLGVTCPYCHGKWFDENLLYLSTVVLRCATCGEFLEVRVETYPCPQPPPEFIDEG